MEFEEFKVYKPWISFIGPLGVHTQSSCASCFVLISFLFLEISRGRCSYRKHDGCRLDTKNTSARRVMHMNFIDQIFKESQRMIFQKCVRAVSMI